MLGRQQQKGRDARPAGQDRSDGLLEVLKSSWNESVDKSLVVSFLTAGISRLLAHCSGEECEGRYSTPRELADSRVGPCVEGELRQRAGAELAALSAALGSSGAGAQEAYWLLQRRHSSRPGSPQAVTLGARRGRGGLGSPSAERASPLVWGSCGAGLGTPDGAVGVTGR